MLLSLGDGVFVRLKGPGAVDLELIDEHQRTIYDKIKRKRLYEIVRQEVHRRMHNIQVLLPKFALQQKFEVWVTKTRYLRNSCRKVGPLHRYKPVIATVSIKNSNLITEGVRLLSILFYHKKKEKLINHFLYWKEFTANTRRLLQKCFTHWSIKISKWKLNKLNCIRFIYLCKPLVKRFVFIIIGRSFRNWYDRTQLLIQLEPLKYYLKYWKKMVIVRRLETKNLLKNSLRTLLHVTRKNRLRFQRYTNTIVKRKNHKLLLSYYDYWYSSYRKLRTIQKLFSTSMKYKLFMMFTKWKMFETDSYSNDNSFESIHPVVDQNNSANIRRSSTPKSGYRAATYQANDTIVYRKYIKIKQPRRGVAPGKRSKASNSVVHSMINNDLYKKAKAAGCDLSTLEGRISYRLIMVHELDDEFHEREVRRHDDSVN